jgi:hypothetical protein
MEELRNKREGWEDIYLGKKKGGREGWIMGEDGGTTLCFSEGWGDDIIPSSMRQASGTGLHYICTVHFTAIFVRIARYIHRTLEICHSTLVFSWSSDVADFLKQKSFFHWYFI